MDELDALEWVVALAPLVSAFLFVASGWLAEEQGKVAK